jgi:hypothetical protein
LTLTTARPANSFSSGFLLIGFKEPTGMIDTSPIQQFYKENKDWIAAVGTVGGFLATFSKTVFGFLNDVSWNRRTDKNVKLVGQLIHDIHQAESAPGGLQSQSLEPYLALLRVRLDKLLIQLQSARQRVQERALARYYDPSGVRRWLLLYRPFGIRAWIVHSCFYAALLLLVIVPIGMTKATLRDPNGPDWPTIAILTGIYCILPLLPRSVALNARRFAISSRGESDPNRALAPWRKLLLFFRSRGVTAWIEHILFYLFLVDILSIPFWFAPAVYRGSTALQSVLVTTFCEAFIGLIAWLFWQDVLLRRSISLLNPKAK